MATIDIDTYELRGKRWVISKDPNATLDYGFDWTRWLAAISDTIVDAEFIVDPSLVITGQGFDSTHATVWLSGGSAMLGDGPIRVTSRITTLGGRTDDRSIYLHMLER